MAVNGVIYFPGNVLFLTRWASAILIICALLNTYDIFFPLSSCGLYLLNLQHFFLSKGWLYLTFIWAKDHQGIFLAKGVCHEWWQVTW